MLSKKRSCETQSKEKKTTDQDKDRLSKKICCEAQSIEKKTAKQDKKRLNMKRSREAESTDKAAKRKDNNNASKKKKRHHQVSHDKEMSNAIERAMKEAKQILHRTQHTTNPHSHKAIVCIVCDRFIIGTEKIHKLTSYQISQHSNRLSVKTYKTYHAETLKVEIRKQYQVNGDELNDLLLSPQSRKFHNGYATCACCYKEMCQKLRNKKAHPNTQ